MQIFHVYETCWNEKLIKISPDYVKPWTHVFHSISRINLIIKLSFNFMFDEYTNIAYASTSMLQS